MQNKELEEKLLSFVLDALEFNDIQLKDITKLECNLGSVFIDCSDGTTYTLTPMQSEPE